MKKIHILLDSSSGMTSGDANEEIGFIPLVLVDEKNKSHEDDYSILKPLTLFSYLENNFWKTSQTNIQVLENYIDEKLKSFEKIIYIPISYSISGMYDSACNLLKQEKYKNKLVILKTKSISSGLKNFALDLLQKIKNENFKHIDEYQKLLDEYDSEFDSYFTTPDLQYLKKGGRLSSAKLMMGMLLQIRPIFRFYGETNSVVEKVRTTNKAYEVIAQNILKSIKNRNLQIENLTICMLHTFKSQEETSRIAKYFEEILKTAISIHYMPGAVSCHVGVNACGLCYYRKSNR